MVTVALLDSVVIYPTLVTPIRPAKWDDRTVYRGAPESGRSIVGMNLSSQLTYNMRHGAEDLRIMLTTDITNNFLPQSWQDSLAALSYSVIGLLDSVIRGIGVLL